MNNNIGVNNSRREESQKQFNLNLNDPNLPGNSNFAGNSNNYGYHPQDSTRETQIAQFESNSEEFRCCCDCCHVKTATVLIGSIELLFVLYFLIGSLILVSSTGNGLESSGSLEDPQVKAPFIACLVCLGLGVVAIILLFFAVARKSACLLLPHIILQVISIVLFFGLIICAALAFSTGLTIFYRVLNLVAFNQTNDNNTVNLNFGEQVGIVIGLTVFCLGFLLEIWFTFIVHRCYRYFEERQEYVRYVRQYSLPLNAVPYGNSVPQYTPR